MPIPPGQASAASSQSCTSYCLKSEHLKGWAAPLAPDFLFRPILFHNMSIEEWYKSLPIVTRTYVTLASLTTAGCALEVR